MDAASLTARVAGGDDPGVDSGDTAWLLASSALVLMMTPALALFYGGLVSERAVVATMYLSLACIPVVAVTWSLVGYSLAFARNSDGRADPWIGGMGFGAFDSGDRVREGTAVPESGYFLFQLAFATITCAVASGSVVGRIRVWAWLAFIAAWSVLVYAPIARWAFYPRGLLASWGVLDFAGGLPVETTSGVSAWVLAAWVGWAHERRRRRGASGAGDDEAAAGGGGGGDGAVGGSVPPSPTPRRAPPKPPSTADLTTALLLGAPAAAAGAGAGTAAIDGDGPRARGGGAAGAAAPRRLARSASLRGARVDGVAYAGADSAGAAQPQPPPPPASAHSVPMVVLGAGMLAFGWLGFNGGSAIAAGFAAARAVANTHLAGAGGVGGWALAEVLWGPPTSAPAPARLCGGRPTAVGAATGLLAGLVAVTPAAGYVSQLSALSLGAVAAVVSYWAVRGLKAWARVDDRLDCLAIHGVAGGVGVLGTGLLARVSEGAPVDGVLAGGGGELLGKQAAALSLVVAAAAIGTSACFGLVAAAAWAIGVPVDLDADEQQAPDAGQHGEPGYGAGGGGGGIF